MIDWKGIAPKRKDWERLTVLFVAGGLPKPCWLNGVPVFPQPVDEERVRKLLENAPVGGNPPAPTGPTADPPKKKGWPKGKPRHK